MRLVLVLCLAGCYPVCVTDADCEHGTCQIDGENRQCVPLTDEDAGVDAFED